MLMASIQTSMILIFKEVIMRKCCLCGKEFTGWGNDPWPVDKDPNHECCDECNERKVIPVRITYFINKEDK